MSSSQILSWFADMQRPDSPFSLYALMEHAKKQGNKAGDWFGPSQVALLIRSVFQLNDSLLGACVCPR